MKWAIPKEPFLIFGIWHSVEIRELTDAEASEVEGGFYDQENRIIIIDKSIPSHLWPEIFTHEVEEAINHLTNLKMNHTQISVTSLGYHNVFNQLVAETEAE